MIIVIIIINYPLYTGYSQHVRDTNSVARVYSVAAVL
jgi:hypothetical protein